MSASARPITVAEFLAWEREQPDKWEFDGVQPVPLFGMTGGSVRHARIAARLIAALSTRLGPGCEALGSDLKVLTAETSRVRYPDVTVVCGVVDGGSDTIEPVAVFEVASPSTALTDRNVKVPEYQRTPSVQVIILLEQDRAEATLWRRATGWEPERTDLALALPEIGIPDLPLAPLHR